MSDLILSLLEARVLGVLVEKQKTVPDSYPLSLNSLQNGCNQKSSRNPIIEASEAEVQMAVDNLRRLSFVMESSGGRTMRYAHNVDRLLKIPQPALVILTVLILRGPLTLAEIRSHTGRMYDFADISSVETYCQELATREPQALLCQLDNLPGSREKRWASLLCGTPNVEEINLRNIASASVATSELAILKASVGTLEDRVAYLEKELTRVLNELGMAQ